MELIWNWWGAMFMAGLLLGCAGAWSTQAARVFIRTLGGPVLLVLARLAWPNVYPIKNSPLYVFLDFLILATAAAIADYYLGMKLGRNGRDGFRTDSVGH